MAVPALVHRTCFTALPSAAPPALSTRASTSPAARAPADPHLELTDQGKRLEDGLHRLVVGAGRGGRGGTKSPCPSRAAMPVTQPRRMLSSTSSPRRRKARSCSSVTRSASIVPLPPARAAASISLCVCFIILPSRIETTVSQTSTGIESPAAPAPRSARCQCRRTPTSGERRGSRLPSAETKSCASASFSPPSRFPSACCV